MSSISETPDFSGSDATVNITVRYPDGAKHLTARHGELLLDVLRTGDMHVPSPCGGKGTCKKCRVEVVGEGPHLSCQYRVVRDCEVVLAESKDAVILAAGNASLKRVVDDAGLVRSVEGAWRHVTYRGRELLVEQAVDGDTSSAFGVAVDIGTTTVVAYLIDLCTYEVRDVASVLNPQATHGQDVIARINYVIEHTGGLITLQKSIVDAIGGLLVDLCSRNAVDRNSMYVCTAVGNTVMMHLFHGVSPATIGQAPYTPVFVDERTVKAGELGLPMNPQGAVRTLPSISGYVGADIVAGVAATPMMQSDRFSLLLDIGTNGEMALGNKDVVYCCATAAGPAFEGACISCGVGGVEGAIAHFDGESYSTIGSTLPVGLCGSGLLDLVALLVDKGLIDMTGCMEADYLIERQESTDTDHDIVLTPQDVREVQLAKAAIRAGITILVKNAGITFADVEHVYLAGGFGNYLRAESALQIGMLPPELRGKVVPVGNSAGIGAQFALRSMRFDVDIRAVVDKAKYIELSMRQDFNEEYVNGMMFE